MKRLIEKNIPKNTNNYNHHVYLWEVVETGRHYVGYHKGVADPEWDGYTTSSKSKEFIEDFQNPNYTLKYTCLGYYKTSNEAKRYEGKEIRNRFDKGENLYNIHPGNKFSWDENKVQETYKKLVKMIENGTYEVRPKDEIPTLGWIQVRENEDPSLITELKHKINDIGGSIENTDPLIVALTDDGEKRIDGYHTGQGILGSKATRYKRIDVDVKGWKYIEIVRLGSLFNDNPKVEKKMSVNDYVKQGVALWVEEGIEPDSQEFRDWLMGYKSLTSPTKTSIVNKTTKKINTKKKELKYNRKWKNYTDKEKKELASNGTKNGVLTIVMGSGRDIWNRLIQHIFDNDGNLIPGYNEIKLLIHHTSSDNQDDWRQGKGKKVTNILKQLTTDNENSDTGISSWIHWEELECWESDSK